MSNSSSIRREKEKHIVVFRSLLQRYPNYTSLTDKELWIKINSEPKLKRKLFNAYNYVQLFPGLRNRPLIEVLEIRKKHHKRIEKNINSGKPKVKKTEVFVNGKNLPVSTKYAKAICKFIKNKRIGNAIRDLEIVTVQKQAVPMKGDVAHKR